MEEQNKEFKGILASLKESGDLIDFRQRELTMEDIKNLENINWCPNQSVIGFPLKKISKNASKK